MQEGQMPQSTFVFAKIAQNQFAFADFFFTNVMQY
jgi:hypothetical protein